MKVLVMFLILLAGCSSIYNEGSLFSFYERYLVDAKRDNIKLIYRDFFDDALVADVDINNSFIIEQLLFKENMKKIISHKESLYKDYGCLTVNGVDNDGKPIAINVEFSNHEPKWLMKDVDILLLDTKEDYSNTAVCPKEYVIH
ncbi:hypothetical protein [Photobacterium chitinilyticum]|uniref:DUF3828 domain-containing protein n=1 Tax=Photobacterium chitinilyticum TaxID=2485123 RepID=A0A3S3RDX8_9GAMM|nr:hypothetical protein [Photobacterium chitinilyticum]RWX52692.1 hypothetical protein EDI28_26065 [Photobacterium chitinilyticum]